MRLQNARTTLAVVIGASKFHSGLFPPLPGAAADARAVRHALASWGVRPQNIRLLVGEDATRDNVLRALRVWPFSVASGGDIRLLVFYAGHAARVEETGTPDSSVLITYNVDPSDRKATGVSLSDLMSALARVRPVETYLFLDACSLRINTVENILPDADVLTASESSCLFCFVASGLKDAFEDAVSQSGYFTASILRHLSMLRHKQSDCSELVRRVQADLLALQLPAAEYYLIGNAECFPLPVLLEQDLHESHTLPEMVARNAPLSALQDIIVQNPGKIVWVWGESGRGKTVLVRQLLHQTADAVYVSFPADIRQSTDLWMHVATEIADQSPALFPSGRPLPGEALNTLKHISDRMPGCALIFDHAERLPTNYISDLLSELRDSTLRVFVVSRHRPSLRNNVIGWECPLLNREEIAAFRQLYGQQEHISTALLEVVTRRNPLEVRALLAEGGTSPLELLKSRTSRDIEIAIGSIVGTNGFVDERLFKQCFHVNGTHLSRLSEMGLLVFQQGRYVPHDSLLELAADLNLRADQDSILDYFVSQVQETPRNLWACQRLAELTVNFGYRERFDSALVSALESLARVRNWSTVEKVGSVIADCSMSPSYAALYAAEQLVRLARYTTVDRVLHNFSKLPLPADIRVRAQLVEAERTWWFGDYERAIELSNTTINESTDEEVRLNAKVNLGIAYFFRGEWKHSIEILTEVLNSDQLGARMRGWANLMLGTNYGLPGLDVERGHELLMSAIRLLDQVGDDAGLAVAWGNLGEFTFKTGDYRAALVQLTEGYALAAAIGGPALKIEIARCLVHLRLRMNGPWSEELQDALALTTELYESDMGRTVGMQLWNTFATVAAYRGDVDELSDFIARAEVHTAGNDEWHIYTLENKAFLAALLGDEGLAQLMLTQAVELAAAGGNSLAVRQIFDDLNYVIVHSHPSRGTTLSSFAATLRTEIGFTRRGDVQ